MERLKSSQREFYGQYRDFISILIMTQLISFLHFLLTAVRTGRLGLLPIRIYRGNNAVIVSVDLIGEKNQAILE